jgi:hypothetical protein
MIYIKLLYPFFVYDNMIHEIKTKAERISDFNFIYEKKTNFISFYKSANVDVIVNDIKKTINLSTYNINGGEIKYNCDINNTYKKILENYNIDFTDIINDYKIALNIAVEENIKIQKEYYINQYRNSFIVNEIPNLKIPNGVSIEYPTEKEYVENKLENRRSNNLYVIIKYKDYSEKIIVSNNYKGNRPYTLNGKITKNKSRCYKNLQSLIDKFILLVNFDISRTEAERKAKIERHKIILDKMKKLKNSFESDGVKINNGLWHSRKHNKLSDRYFIKIENDSFEHEISFNSKGLYTLGNFYNLKEKQVKEIINVLKKG